VRPVELSEVSWDQCSGVSFLFRLYQLYSTYIYIREHILFNKIRLVCIVGVTVAAVLRRLDSLDYILRPYC